MRIRTIIVILCFALSSCAHAISERYVKNALTEVGFTQIRVSADEYLNNTFILGGTIVETVVKKELTEIEILQNPVDRYGKIKDRDVSEGRFIIISSRHIDPLIYKAGRTLTIAGKLIGSRTKQLGESEYSYPLFEAEEIHLWKEDRYDIPLYYYDPLLYYPYYWHDPFWFRRPYFYLW